MARRLGGWAARATGIALAGLLTALLATEPASAHPASQPPDHGGGLQMSATGADFGSGWSGPLFAPTPTLVPGGSATAVLYVRNATNQASTLTVSLHTAPPVPFTISVDGAATVPPGRTGPLLGPLTLRAGQTQAIPVRLGLPRDAGNVTQRQDASAVLIVGLGEQTATIVVAGESRSIDDPRETAPGPALSYTGFPVGETLTWGLLLLTSGVLALAIRRRHHRPRDLPGRRHRRRTGRPART